MVKKIAIIGTVGLPAKYGGFETLAEYLTKYLFEQFDITVYCSSKFYKTRQKTYNQAQLKYIPLQANGVQSILYDILAISSALRFADCLLILGVSGCVVLPIIKLISNKTILINIDGIKWKRAKWGPLAKWFLKYSEKLAVKYADIVITDNKVIQKYVQNSYGVSSKCIAYGADHTNKAELSPEVLAKYPFLKQPYAFKVCRIEPENNVSMILEAFSECKNMDLVMVGNWENNTYGKQLQLQFKKYKNIHLLDPIYEQDTLDQLRSNCRIYIHGHSAGGTNPSLVEAMYLGLPVLAYDVGYNKETTAHKARYFNNKEELIFLLNALKPEELQTAAKNLQASATSLYTWKTISDQYAALLIG